MVLLYVLGAALASAFSPQQCPSQLRRIKATRAVHPTIEFVGCALPEPVAPDACFFQNLDQNGVALFTFNNPLSVMDWEPAWNNREENFPKMLVQVDLESVGTKHFINNVLPELHAACAAAEIDLRVYTTVEDARACYATDLLKKAGRDAVDTRIIWDASAHAHKDSGERQKHMLVVTNDHFGSTLANLGSVRDEWPVKAPNQAVSSVTAESTLPSFWKKFLGVKTLNGLQNRGQKRGMLLRDAEGTIHVPALLMSAFQNETRFVKCAMVMKNSAEVLRLERFLWRYSAATGFGAFLRRDAELEQETRDILRCIDPQGGGGGPGFLGSHLTRPADQAQQEENKRRAEAAERVLSWIHELA